MEEGGKEGGEEGRKGLTWVGAGRSRLALSPGGSLLSEDGKKGRRLDVEEGWI